MIVNESPGWIGPLRQPAAPRSASAASGHAPARLPGPSDDGAASRSAAAAAAAATTTTTTTATTATTATTTTATTTAAAAAAAASRQWRLHVADPGAGVHQRHQVSVYSVFSILAGFLPSFTGFSESVYSGLDLFGLLLLPLLPKFDLIFTGL